MKHKKPQKGVKLIKTKCVSRSVFLQRQPVRVVNITQTRLDITDFLNCNSSGVGVPSKVWYLLHFQPTFFGNPWSDGGFIIEFNPLTNTPNYDGDQKMHIGDQSIDIAEQSNHQGLAEHIKPINSKVKK